MDNSLVNYLNSRFVEKKSIEKTTINRPGPVITISREVGCNGIKLANLLVSKLNQNRPDKNWKVLSKEVFYKSAKELNLKPELVRKTLKSTDKYLFEQILKAFGDKNYKSERKITRTVIDVIKDFAIEGHCIIVGRAGHIIASEIKDALHVRLVAPLEYRINTIMKNNQLSHEEAQRFIAQVENERIAFRNAIKKEVLYHDERFDLTLNLANFNNEEVVSLLASVIKIKQMETSLSSKLLLV